MKTIEIEDVVYLALKEKIQDFGEKPNDVIKRLLAKSGDYTDVVPHVQETKEKSPLTELIEKPEYKRGNAKDRYFDVLRCIYRMNPTQFGKIEGFRKGSRVQFSKDRAIINQSGRHTYPQLLDETPYWVMTNLSNERKQAVLKDAMQFLGYTEDVINSVVGSIVA